MGAASRYPLYRPLPACPSPVAEVALGPRRSLPSSEEKALGVSREGLTEPPACLMATGSGPRV